MDTALHRGDGDVPYFTDYELACVAYGGGSWEMGDFCVGDFCWGGEFVGERA
jgi:hypothetical protein